MLYTVTDIKYDTDGKRIALPKVLEIEVDESITDGLEIEEFLSDEISNRTGFCHYGFSISPKIYNYYQKEIEKLGEVIPNPAAPQVKIITNQGRRKTNWMNINEESAPVLIKFLQQFLKPNGKQ